MSHRGLTINYPENTINAYMDGIENGFNAIELDVVRSKDGELICSHNLELEVETNGHGYFKDYTIEELKKIKTGVYSHPNRTQGVSTLKEVFKAVPRNVFLNIEIKTESWLDLDSVRILNKYRKQGLIKHNYLVSTFNPFVVFYIRHFTRLKRVGFLIAYRDWVWMINWIHPDAVHPTAELLSDSLIKRWKKNRLMINTWTVNNLSALKFCFKKDIDGIITDSDKPLLFKDIL